MARRSSFITAINQAARMAEKERNQATRDAERERKQQLARQTQRAKEAERANKLYLKSIEQQSKMDAKEQAKLYIESRIAQVDLQNEQLEQTIKDFNNVLIDTLSVDDYLDSETLKKDPPIIDPFDQGLLKKYLPKELNVMQKLVPGAKQRFEKEVQEAQDRYKREFYEWRQKEKELIAQVATHNEEMERFQQNFSNGDPNAIVDYLRVGYKSL